MESQLGSRPTSSHTTSSTSSLFQVFLRLRPPPLPVTQHNGIFIDAPASRHLPERYLTVEPPSLPSNDSAPASTTNGSVEEVALYPNLPSAEESSLSQAPPQQAVPTHITIHPPSESRKRAVEKFGFTRVFEETSSQLDMFQGTGVSGVVDGVLSAGRDGLVATLGVTGSGKVSYLSKAACND